MSGFMKLVLILFGLAYLISPVDLIPDLLAPWLGWIDDGVILWSIYSLIRHNELPWFLFKKKAGNPFSRPGSPAGRRARADSGTQKNSRTQSTSQQGSTKQEAKRSKNGDRHGTASDKSGPGTQSPPSPHEILGVPVHASRQEIQRTYKEKIKQYHPDKLSHLGKEFADLANEKFLEIQAAYDELMK